jgi:hypothetical protein
MAELYDPQRVKIEDWHTYFLERTNERFILRCIEGDVEMSGPLLHINLVLTMPLINRQRPISRDRHLFLSGIYGASAHAEIMTRISQSLENDGYTREELCEDMIMTVMHMHNLCYTHLGAYVQTMDIFGIAETLAQPQAKAAVTIDYGDIEDGQINRMEKAFKDQTEAAIKLLSSDELDINVFRAPLKCNALKVGQFAQFVCSAGPRTDTDDHVFLRPVVGSFLSGMKGIVDLAIESRSAAKATHYNKSQMALTQYNNRKNHIQASVTWHLYSNPDGTFHDCGSTNYMEYEPNKRTVERYLGKFYLDEEGKLVELTRERFNDVIGKMIKVRDVPLCRYTDGYCEVCGGTITKSFSRHGNVGFLSNVNTGAPVAQQVLSTKHLTSTNAAEYKIPHDLDGILMSTTNDIFLVPEVHNSIKVLAFGFQPGDISKINDLKYYISENELHAAYFSEIKYMSVGQLNPDGKTISRTTTRTAMKGEANTYPHLSPEVLNVIRNHREDIIMQDGLAWFVLRNINPKVPIMQCTVVNNSIKRFVRNFTELITKRVENFTSLNKFMSVLSKLVWEEGKVPTHVTHMSCLVRSCLITSRRDFHVPLVEDPDNVMFGSLNRIIPMRSIGALMAYQNIDQATNNPITYITPKLTGIFDEYMGYHDLMDRDRHWPVSTGSALEHEPIE